MGVNFDAPSPPFDLCRLVPVNIPCFEAFPYLYPRIQELEEKEKLRILFLDKRNQIIADEVQQTGTIDHTPVYPREVIKRSLELSATAILLVHNHPSGDPSPSSSDIQMTQQIADIAHPLGIRVHDHIIIGRQGHTSLRSLNLID